MLYDAYKNKIQKVAAVRHWLWKFKVPLIIALSVFVASLTTFLCVRGKITQNVSLAQQEIFYGDEYRLNKAKALLSNVKYYEYSEAGSDSWTKKKPTAAGSYYVRAVTSGGFGKKRGESVAFTILPRPAEMRVLSNVDTQTPYSVYYGDALKVQTQLVQGDTLALDTLAFTLDDPAQLDTQADIDKNSIKVHNAAGDDVTRCYAFTTIKAPVSFMRRPITVTPQSASCEYDGKPHAFSAVPDAATRANLAYGADVLFQTEFLEGGAQYAERAGVYTVRIDPETVRFYAQGKDVTHCYETVSLGYARFTVTRRPLSVVTADAEKFYDGTPLSAGQFTHEGAVNGHTVFLRYTARLPEQTTADTRSNNIAVEQFGVTDGATDVTENYDITVSFGTLTVKQRPIVVTTASQQKEFDGSPLVNTNASIVCTVPDALGNRLPAGQQLTPTQSTSITNVWENAQNNNKVTYRIADVYTQKDYTSNYSIRYEYGTLGITPCAVRIFSQQQELLYDGQEHDNAVATAVYAGEGSGLGVLSIAQCRIADKAKIVSQRNAGTLHDPYAYDDYGFYDAMGNDIGANFAVAQWQAGYVTVSARPIEVRPVVFDKMYDGTADIQIDWQYDGELRFIEGESPDMAWLTNVAPVDVNAYTVVSLDLSQNRNPRFLAQNYNVTYTGERVRFLVYSRPLAVTTASDRKTYDGEPLSSRAFTTAGEAAGHYVVLEDSAVDIGITDVGSCLNDYAVGYFSVYAGREDVTHNYTISVTAGELTVTPKTITVVTASDQKIYDGDPLYKTDEYRAVGFVENKGHTLVWDEKWGYASQTAVGSVRNTLYFFVTDRNGAPCNNYTIDYEHSSFGMLTVTPRDLVLRAKGNTFLYDTAEHSETGYEIVSGTLAPRQTPVAVESTVTRLINATTAVVNGQEDNGGVENGTRFIIVNAEGTDVTSNYTLQHEKGGLLVVRRYRLGITTQTDTLIYNGAPQSLTGCTHTGLLAGHAIGADRQNTTARTDVGQEPNKTQFVITENGVSVTDNYFIEYTFGTLNIAPRPLAIERKSLIKEYDGTPLVGNEYQSAEGLLTERGHTLRVSNTATSITAVAQSGAVIQTTFAVWANGKNVSGNYAIAYVGDATLTVTPRNLAVYTQGNTWEYDGKAHSELRFEVIHQTYNESTGTWETDDAFALVSDADMPERVETVFVTVQNVADGAKDNEYTFLPKENYRIVRHLYGKIAITPRSVHIRPNDGGKTYDASGYDRAADLSAWQNGRDWSYVNDTRFVSGEMPRFHWQYASDKYEASLVPEHADTYDVAPYAITGDAPFFVDNYTIVCHEGKLVIASLKVYVTIQPQCKTYNGEVFLPDIGMFAYTGDARFYQTPAVAWSFTDRLTGSGKQPLHAGTYDINARLQDNASMSFTASDYDAVIETGELIIAPRNISIAISDAEKIYDGQAYDHAVAARPWVYTSPDTFADGEMPTFTWLYNDEQKRPVRAGTYVLGVKLSNNETILLSDYTVTITFGTLTVHKRTVYICPTAQKQYDGTETIREVLDIYPDGISDDNKFVENFLPVLVWKYTEAGAHKNAGAYRIALDTDNTPMETENYILQQAGEGVLTVLPREVTVAAHNGRKEYDGLPYDRAADLSAWQNGRDWSYVSGSQEFIEIPVFTWLYDRESAPPKNAGMYLVTPYAIYDGSGNGFLITNYHVSWDASMLVIDPRKVTVQIADGRKVYDGLPYDRAADLSAWQDGRDWTYASGSQEFIEIPTFTWVYNGTLHPPKNAGKYTVSVGTYSDGLSSGFIQSNYEITVTDGALVISQRDVYLMIENNARVYNGYAYDHNLEIGSPWVYATDDPLHYFIEIPSFVWTYRYGDFSSDTSFTVTDAPVAAGEYRIVAKAAIGAENYRIVWRNQDGYGRLTIRQREIVVRIEGSMIYRDEDSRVYDFYVIENSPYGIVYGETAALSYVQTDRPVGNAGDYIITSVQWTQNGAFDPANYDITVADGCVFTVLKRTVYILPYGGKTYDGTGDYRNEDILFTYTGESQHDDAKRFLADETPLLSWVLPAAPVNVTENGYAVYLADVHENGAFNPANYEIVADTGAFTVAPRHVRLALDGDSKVYDARPYVREDTAEGVYWRVTDGSFVDGERPLLAWVYTAGDTAVTPIDAGTYTVRVALNDNGAFLTSNYAFTQEEATLVISKRAVSVWTDDVSLVYGEVSEQKPVAWTVHMSAQDEEVFDYMRENGMEIPQLHWLLSAVDGAMFPDAGRYAVALDESQEYDNFVFGNDHGNALLTVTPRAIVVTPHITDSERPFDGTDVFALTPACTDGTSFAFDEKPSVTWQWDTPAHSAPGTYTVWFGEAFDNPATGFKVSNYTVTAGASIRVTVHNKVALSPSLVKGQYTAAAHLTVGEQLAGKVHDGKNANNAIAGFTFRATVQKLVRENDALGNSDGKEYTSAVNAGTYWVYYNAVTFDALHEYTSEQLAALGLEIVNDIEGGYYRYRLTITPITLHVRPQEASLLYPGGRYISIGERGAAAAAADIFSGAMAADHVFVIEQTERIDITAECERQIGILSYRIADGNGNVVQESANNYKVYCVGNGYDLDRYRAKLTVEKVALEVVRLPMAGNIEDRTVVYNGQKTIDVPFASWGYTTEQLAACYDDSANALAARGQRIEAYGVVQFLLSLIAPSPGQKSAWLKVHVIGNDGAGDYNASLGYAVKYTYLYETDASASADEKDYSVLVVRAQVNITQDAAGNVTVTWGNGEQAGQTVSPSADGSYALCGTHRLRITQTADGLQIEAYDALSGKTVDINKYYQCTVTSV
ncbi:MAG: hypothetical protein HFE46_04400 [Clostridia bacterium]|jgi:hypothetical protein|nr:hypothetical protein [Clostridia bacterium]